jgi:hypothetical protein
VHQRCGAITDGTTDQMKDYHPMSNLTLFIIRHAEKPDEAWPGPGLTEDGQADNKSLVIRGWHRAGSWAVLFGGSYRDFPAPGAIYAANPVSGAGEEVSQRPLQTVRPLAERLHLTPITHWGHGDENRVAADVTKRTGVVLVCWEHKLIASALLPALLGTQKLPGVPSKWHGDRFDVVLRLDRAAAAEPWSFQQQFPRLLSGDTDVPM